MKLTLALRHENKWEAFYPIIINFLIIIFVLAEWEDGIVHYVQWLLPINALIMVGCILENFVFRGDQKAHSGEEKTQSTLDVQ